MAKGQIQSKAKLISKKKKDDEISNEDLIFYAQNFFYMVVVGFTAYFEYQQDDIMVKIFKPMGMALIGIYYFFLAKTGYSFSNLLVQCALLFALAGDILLTFKENSLFQMGTASFFLTHTFYCLHNVINLFSVKSPFKFGKAQAALIVLPVIALVIINLYLQPKVPAEIQKYGIAYSVMIGLSFIVTVLRSGKTSAQSYTTMLLGYGLFLTSDMTLTMTKFDHIEIPILFAGYTILYFLGQLMIYHSLSNHQKFLLAHQKKQN